MKIFISSVRRGLESERDALPGLIQAIGFEPRRFEDYTAQSVPSREACLRGVNDSDVYVLLLGPHYGHPFEDTGQSPTHDEWAAAVASGMPRLVFKKVGIEYDDDQQQFIRTVGAYTSGVFYKEFTAVADLLVKVAESVRDIAAAPQPLTFEALPGPVEVPWRERRGQYVTTSSTHTGPALELHVVPIGADMRSARVMSALAEAIPRRIRDARIVADDKGVDVERPDGAITVLFQTERRGWNSPQKPAVLGLTVRANGQVSIWSSLPADGMGAILDADALPAQVASLLRMVGALNVVDTRTAAVALGLDRSSGLSAGSVGDLPRSSASMLNTGDRFVHVEPDEAVSVAALGVGADEVGALLARSLIAAAVHR